MKIDYIFTVTVISAGLLSGCGSASSGSDNGTSSQANVVRERSNSNVASSTTDQPNDGIPNSGQPGNIDVNAPMNGNPFMSRRRRMVENPRNGPVPPPASYPAPENSSVTVIMANDGSVVETRVFATDKYISKVEKISNGSKRTAAIYLKSGRSIQVPADEIPVINTISVAELMQLARIKAPPAAASPGNADESTKKRRQ